MFLMFFFHDFSMENGAYMPHICHIYPHMPFKNSKNGQLGTLPFPATPFFPTLSGDLHGIQGRAADSRATWHETLKTSMVKNANGGISGISWTIGMIETIGTIGFDRSNTCLASPKKLVNRHFPALFDGYFLFQLVVGAPLNTPNLRGSGVPVRSPSHFEKNTWLGVSIPHCCFSCFSSSVRFQSCWSNSQKWLWMIVCMWPTVSSECSRTRFFFRARVISISKNHPR